MPPMESCACGHPSQLDPGWYGSGALRDEHGVDRCVIYRGEPWSARYAYTEPVHFMHASPAETEG